jgi:hypothetical protein
MNNPRIHKMAYEYMPIGRRGEGQPRQRWTVRHPRRRTNIGWLIHRWWWWPCLGYFSEVMEKLRTLQHVTCQSTVIKIMIVDRSQRREREKVTCLSPHQDLWARAVKVHCRWSECWLQQAYSQSVIGTMALGAVRWPAEWRELLAVAVCMLNSPSGNSS